MSSRYPIQEKVKVLIITKPNQKINFQIRHPENVYAITGIAVTCSYIPGRTKEKFPSNAAGNLSLAIPAKGDVVFGECVQVRNNFSEALEEDIFKSVVDRTFPFSGTRMSYLDTFHVIKDAILEGYYEDTLFNGSDRGIVGLTELTNRMALEVVSPIEPALRSLYKVSIYLRYQTFKD